jgi:hypothetical protein
MRQPDSDRKIEITIDGEGIRGTVDNGGAAEMSVRLDQPVNAWTISLHMANFARPVHPEGFLGKYGEERVLELRGEPVQGAEKRRPEAQVRGCGLRGIWQGPLPGGRSSPSGAWREDVRRYHESASIGMVVYRNGRDLET